MPTKDDLKYFQAMPLEIKIGMTKNRITEWVREFGMSGVYVSFSGGKDSTVLLHIVRELFPDIETIKCQQRQKARRREAIAFLRQK